MGLGKINVWIREPDDCTVSEMDGFAWAKPCCAKNRNLVYQASLKRGHSEIEVPPGCYIVDAAWTPGCCGTAKETVVIINCGETACVNLIREWAGDASGIRLASMMNHAREAKVSEADIRVMKDIFEKISKVLPEGKIRHLTEKEFELKNSVSDEPHKKILSDLAVMIKKP
jgi:hypothetical protein